jgi:hypothetical protein
LKDAEEGPSVLLIESEQLRQHGTSYSYDAVKIFMPAGAKKPVYAPYREHDRVHLLAQEPQAG